MGKITSTIGKALKTTLDASAKTSKKMYGNLTEMNQKYDTINKSTKVFQTKWEQQSKTEIHNTSVELGDVTFTQFVDVSADQTQAQKDKQKRLSEKNTQIAEQIAASLKKLEKTAQKSTSSGIEKKRQDKTKVIDKKTSQISNLNKQLIAAQKKQIKNTDNLRNQLVKVLKNQEQNLKTGLGNSKEALVDTLKKAGVAFNKDNRLKKLDYLILWMRRIQFQWMVTKNVAKIFSFIGKAHIKFYKMFFKSLYKVGFAGAKGLFWIAKFIVTDAKKAMLAALFQGPKAILRRLFMTPQGLAAMGVAGLVIWGFTKLFDMDPKVVQDKLRWFGELLGDTASGSLADIMGWWKATVSSIPRFKSWFDDMTRVWANEGFWSMAIQAGKDSLGYIGNFIIGVLQSVKNNFWDLLIKPMLKKALDFEVKGVNLADMIWTDDAREYEKENQSKPFTRDMKELMRVYYHLLHVNKLFVEKFDQDPAAAMKQFSKVKDQAIKILAKKVKEMFGVPNGTYLKSHSTVAQTWRRLIFNLEAEHEAGKDITKLLNTQGNKAIVQMNSLEAKKFIGKDRVDWARERDKKKFAEEREKAAAAVKLKNDISDAARQAKDLLDDLYVKVENKTATKQEQENFKVLKKNYKQLTGREWLPNKEIKSLAEIRGAGEAFGEGVDKGLDKGALGKTWAKGKEYATKGATFTKRQIEEGLEARKNGTFPEWIKRKGQIAGDYTDKAFEAGLEKFGFTSKGNKLAADSTGEAAAAGSVLGANAANSGINVQGGTQYERIAKIVRVLETNNTYNKTIPNDNGAGIAFGAYQLVEKFGHINTYLSCLIAAGSPLAPAAKTHLGKFTKSGKSYRYSGDRPGFIAWLTKTGATEDSKKCQDAVFKKSFYDPATAFAKKHNITCEKCVTHVVDHYHNTGNALALRSAGNNSAAIAAARIADYKTKPTFSRNGTGWTNRVKKIEGNIDFSKVPEGIAKQTAMGVIGGAGAGIAGATLGDNAMLKNMLGDMLGHDAIAQVSDAFKGTGNSLLKAMGISPSAYNTMFGAGGGAGLAAANGNIASSEGNDLFGGTGGGGGGGGGTSAPGPVTWAQPKSGNCTNKSMKLEGYTLPFSYKNYACPCADHGQRKSTKAIVLHRTAGSRYPGFYNRKCQDGIGAHFTIEKNGTINLDVRDDHVAWHVGGKNYHTVGIEIVGAEVKSRGGYETITKAQARAVVTVTKYLAKKYSISANMIFAHADLDKNKNKWEATNARKFMRAIMNGMGFDQAYKMLLSKEARMDGDPTGMLKNSAVGKTAEPSENKATGSPTVKNSQFSQAAVWGTGGALSSNPINKLMAETGGSEAGTRITTDTNTASGSGLTGKSLKGMQADTVNKLKNLAKEWKAATGYDLHINSAYRSKEYNESIGGSSGSYHIKGVAVDISWIMWKQEVKLQFIHMAGRNGFTGYGIGNKIIHIDTGPVRSWQYKAKGGWTSGVPGWASQAVAEAQQRAGGSSSVMASETSPSLTPPTGTSYVPGVGVLQNADKMMEAVNTKFGELFGQVSNLAKEVSEVAKDNIKQQEVNLTGLLDIKSVMLQPAK